MVYLKRALKWGIIGIPMGISIGAIFIMIFVGRYGTGFLSFPYLLRQYSIDMILGFICSALAVVYTVEHWSIPQRTAAHVTGTAVVYFPAATFAGWITMTPSGVAIFVTGFLVFYLCYWCGFYVYWKLKFRKINDVLRKRGT
ncbi:MAG: DUF3021 domain-containing protein [Ethanoligenens sp.]